MNKTIDIEYVINMPEIKKPGVLYVSKKWGLAIHVCPFENHREYIPAEMDGCNGITRDAITKDIPPPENVMLLKPMWKDGWDLIEHPDGTVSLSPSILNRQCRHHYFIRNNQIILA